MNNFVYRNNWQLQSRNLFLLSECSENYGGTIFGDVMICAAEVKKKLMLSWILLLSHEYKCLYRYVNIKYKKKIFRAVLLWEAAKKVQDKKLVWEIRDVLRFWMIPNWSYLNGNVSIVSCRAVASSENLGPVTWGFTYKLRDFITSTQSLIK